MKKEIKSREIKFRAWDKEHMAWIEPEWVDVRASGTIVRHYVHRGYNIGEDKNPEYLEINQYTGLKDKNGKDIYEGDVITSNQSPQELMSKYIVYYEKRTASFRLQWSTSWNNLQSVILGHTRKLNTENKIEYEVIGNIYENAELLA